MKYAKLLLPLILIGMNAFYFLPYSIKIINTGGGPEGWTLLLLPITLSFNVFLISGPVLWINENKTVIYKFILYFSMTCLAVTGLMNVVFRNPFGIATVLLIILVVPFSFKNIQRCLFILNMAGAVAMVVWIILIEYA